MKKETLDAIVKSLMETIKANPDMVKDLFEDWHALPTEDQIKTGPAQESSGGGAEKMIRYYSEPARQVALAEAYNKVAGMLSDFPTMKADLTALKAAVSAIHTAILCKGKTSGSVSKRLEKALVDLGVLKATKADATAIAKAEKLISRLRTTQAYFAGVEAGNVSEAVKAAYEAVKAEEEDEEDEEVSVVVNQDEKDKETEKAGYMKAVQDIEAFFTSLEKGETPTAPADAAVAAKFDVLKGKVANIKAKANDNHDAGGKFSETNGGGNKTEDERKKEEEKLKAKVAELTSQLDVVSKALGEISANKSGHDIKAGDANAVRSRVLAALDDGTIPEGSEVTAKSLLQQHEAVEKGQLPKEVFNRNLELAPPSVQSVFRVN